MSINNIIETFEEKKTNVEKNIKKNIKKIEKELGTKINSNLEDKKIEKAFSMTNYIPHLILIGILLIAIILAFVYMEEISKFLGINNASNIMPAEYKASYKNN